MARVADEAIGHQSLQAFADRGYFNGPEIKACEDAGIAVFVPKHMMSNAKVKGRLDKADFIYNAQDDEYQRSEAHTYELQKLMRNSNAVFCLKNNKHTLINYKHDS